MQNADFIKHFSNKLRDCVHPITKTEEIQKESHISTMCQAQPNEIRTNSQF